MTFESFLAAGRPDPKTSRAMRRALGLALGVHVVLLVAAVVHAGWKVDEITPPALPIRFFGLPAPPPPPLGSTEQKSRRKVNRRPTPSAVVQPTETTTRAEVTEKEEPHIGPGDPNGTKGSEGPPCETPDCNFRPTPSATFVAPNVASGRLAIDPQAAPYRVTLPPALNRSGMRLWLLAKLCVRDDGTVERVSLLRGADPMLDPLVIATLWTWRYRPYAVNGRPVPFCTNVRYEIATQ